jgi:hypothetical protein
MFDPEYHCQTALERYRRFLDEVTDPMVAAILTLSVNLKEAAWIANPIDSEGQLNVNLTGSLETTDGK